jgi:hypothetical protein
MAFTVPNEASASYTDQSEIDAIDLKILSGLGIGSGVLTGCVVTAQGSPDDTVAVSAGTARINGSNVTCAGGTVNVISGSANPDGSTTTAANASYYRYDLIVLDTSDHLGVIHGTVPAPAWPDYSVNPVFPDYTITTQVVLAAVLIPPTAASITGIASSQIVSKGVTTKANAFHDQAHALSSGTSHTGDLVTTQMPQLSAWSFYHNPTSSTADPTTTSVLYTPAVFAKAGALTTGTGTFRWYNDTGRTLTFSSVRLSLGTAPTGAVATPVTNATFVIDVNKAGTTIFTTQSARPTIVPATDANTGLFTSFAVTTIANASYLTVDIDYVGSTVAGSDLVVQVLMVG